MPSYQVELVFDDNGELTDVNPTQTGGGTKKQRNKVKIKKHLQDEDHGIHITPHSFLYCNSPGCVTYRTSAGYVTICW